MKPKTESQPSDNHTYLSIQEHLAKSCAVVQDVTVRVDGIRRIHIFHFSDGSQLEIPAKTIRVADVIAIAMKSGAL